MRVGLVLSGGGAKGAYQAGIAKALAESGVEVTAISGASIGSLNGAVMSAAPDMTSAAQRLEEIWEHVASDQVLEIDPAIYPRYIALLVSAGMGGLGRVAWRMVSELIKEFSKSEGESDKGVLKDDSLRHLLHEYLNPKDLAQGRDLYVSLYEHISHVESLVHGALTGIGKVEGRESIFKKVQDLSEEEQYEALLASAAIPVLFSSRTIEGKQYSDGGQGNIRKAQGNTPVTPLLGKGLDVIIVSHLSDGSLWAIDDFEDENILELRPSERISESFKDLLGFEEEKIQAWQQQGYSDTIEALFQLAEIGGARAALSDTEAELRKKMDKQGANSHLSTKIDGIKNNR